MAQVRLPGATIHVFTYCTQTYALHLFQNYTGILNPVVNKASKYLPSRVLHSGAFIRGKLAFKDRSLRDS